MSLLCYQCMRLWDRSSYHGCFGPFTAFRSVLLLLKQVYVLASYWGLTRCAPNVADHLWLQTSISNREDGQKAAAAAGLGLAVLAGLSTVSSLAVTAEFVEKVPLLLKVCSSLSQ